MEIGTESGSARTPAAVWLWIMRVAALTGLAIQGGPLIVDCFFSGLSAGAALESLFRGGPVTAGYFTVLWLSRSARRPASLSLGQAIARLMGAAFLLLASVFIALLVRATIGLILIACLPQVLMLIAGTGLARHYPARFREWAVGLVVVLPLATLVFLSFPYPRHGPDYEARAVGCMRTILAAETTYALMNGSLYGSLECLTTPSDCLPDYKASDPPFLDQELLAPERSGYRFAMHPGPQASRSGSPGKIFRGFHSYAVTAVPLKIRRRPLCMDDSGVILARTGARPPEVKDGRCIQDPTTVVIN